MNWIDRLHVGFYQLLKKLPGFKQLFLMLELLDEYDPRLK